MSRDEIKFISASSGGIFTGYALSADKLDLLEQLYLNVGITKLPQLFWQVFAKGLLSNYVDTITHSQDKLEIPLCFTVCYVPLFSIRYYWIYGKYNRTWLKHFKAAINYPFLKIFPSFLHGRFALDGGAADNIPLYPLLKKNKPVPDEGDADLIFVLHFDARYDHRRDFKTDVPVLDLDLSYCNGFKKAHYDYSSETVAERIKLGFEYGEKICKRLFAGDCSKESLKRSIDEIFLEEHTLRQQNFSIDRLLSFLNVAGKTLRNDAHCIKKLY